MLLFIMSEIIIMKKHIPRRNKRNIHKAMSKNKQKTNKNYRLQIKRLQKRTLKPESMTGQN